MAHLALFRKYRSQSFGQLFGQDHVTVTLRNALRLRKAGQAYLFCGPRGTGKTSAARIFSKALNCVGPDAAAPFRDPPEEPCNRCVLCEHITHGTCLDVNEMDAASHTGVENIRDAVIGKVDFAPVEGRHKVYIIDEVHKLSAAAFAALLKTLEEPPPHLVFILATTDPHEVPATIVSRCQRFDFRRIAQQDIVTRLRWICEQESLQADDAALAVIADAADGSLRDALVILEQAVSYANGPITEEVTTALLGVTDKAALFRLGACLLTGQAADALSLLDELVHEGRDLVGLARDMLGHVRALLIARVSRAGREILKISEDRYAPLEAQAQAIEVADLMRAARVLMELEQELKEPVHARLNWEVAIIRLSTEAAARGTVSVTAAPRPMPIADLAAPAAERSAPAPLSALTLSVAEHPGPVVDSAPPASSRHDMPPAPSRRVAPGAGETSGDAASDLSIQAFREVWPQLLEGLKRDKMLPLHGVLLEVKPLAVEGDCCVLAIGSKYNFHMERIESKRVELVTRLSRLLHCPVRMELRVYDGPVSAGLASPAPPAELADSAETRQSHEAFVQEGLDLFGGKIV